MLIVLCFLGNNIFGFISKEVSDMGVLTKLDLIMIIYQNGVFGESLFKYFFKTIGIMQRMDFSP